MGDRLGAVDQAVDAGEIQAGEQLGVRLVGGVGVAGRQFEGEVRDDGVDVLLVVALVELLDPAGRVLQEVPRAHEVEGQAQDGGEGREDQAHVVVQRQPADDAHRRLQLHRDEDLQHVGDDGLVGQDHARRGAGGAGGVLQERLVGALRRQLRMLGQQLGRVLPLLSEAVRQGVGDEHARALRGRAVGEELADRGGGALVGHDGHRGGGIQHRGEVVRVARLGRVVERHRHQAGVHDAEEAVDVLGRVIGEDGHAVAALGDLLQAHAHGLDAGVDLLAGVLAKHALGGVVVVPVAVQDLVGFSLRLSGAEEHLVHTGKRQCIGHGNLPVFIEKLLHGGIDIHRWTT